MVVRIRFGHGPSVSPQARQEQAPGVGRRRVADPRRRDGLSRSRFGGSLPIWVGRVSSPFRRGCSLIGKCGGAGAVGLQLCAWGVGPLRHRHPRGTWQAPASREYPLQARRIDPEREIAHKVLARHPATPFILGK